MSTYKIVGGDRREYGPVDEAQVRQWIAEGRANGDTLVQSEGGVWKKLSQYPEFADVLPAVTPPSLAVAPAPSVSAVVPGLSDPKRAVSGPALALLITAIMDLAMTLFGVLAGAMGWTVGVAGHGMMAPGHGFGDPDLDQLIGWLSGPVGMIGNVFSIVIKGVIIAGALRMMSLRSYGLCMVAAVLAVIPCTAPCCCLGIAAGIWALVVLTRPEVKEAFH